MLIVNYILFIVLFVYYKLCQNIYRKQYQCTYKLCYNLHVNNISVLLCTLTNQITITTFSY